MPYRIDISAPPDDALDQLVQLGALDVEPVNGGLAAIMPDGVIPDAVADALGVTGVVVSPAIGRDSDSVWILRPQLIRAGGIAIAPPGVATTHLALRLTDSTAFGTGLHPTTALCLDALDEALRLEVPDGVLDVGTGSGVLALAALLKGVPLAVGLDIDAAALAIASAHARVNHLSHRLELVRGGPDAVDGMWPLVLANILAGPLMEMAPVLVRRVGHRGRLIMSGIPRSVASEVEQTYRRLGMHRVDTNDRAGWTLLSLRASW